MDPAYSQGLVLAPGQGCERCCNQSAAHDMPVPFQVMNDRGDWLDAIGSMQPDGTVLVVPAGSARRVGHDWLFGVRYAMLDEPQCVLYSGYELPALPFQLPVTWSARTVGTVKSDDVMLTATLPGDPYAVAKPPSPQRAPPPAPWALRVAAAQLLAAESDPTEAGLFPSVGNGFVSTNDNVCIRNEKLCIKTEELCIKNEELCI